MTNPKLAILLLTYKRTDMALLTIRSTIQNLQYPKELISWYVADDGSPKEHMECVLGALDGQNVIGYHNERLRHEGQQDTHNSGLGWNKGLGICHQLTDYVLVLEDDWNLDEPLETIPYMQLLRDNENVGICSFRILTTGADIHTVGYAGNMYFRYDRTTQYAYSGNPHIRHARYTKHYGWFAEDRNPGLIELKADDDYRFKADGDGKLSPRKNDEGPQIWRPVGISQWGSWKHVGSIKTWK